MSSWYGGREQGGIVKNNVSKTRTDSEAMLGKGHVGKINGSRVRWVIRWVIGTTREGTIRENTKPKVKGK